MTLTFLHSNLYIKSMRRRKTITLW